MVAMNREGESYAVMEEDEEEEVVDEEVGLGSGPTAGDGAGDRVLHTMEETTTAPSQGAGSRRGRAGFLQAAVLPALVVCLALAVLGCAITLTRRNNATLIGKEPAQVCTTWECVRAASDVLSSMDLAVDPCEDFYSYACGEWGRHNPLPSGTYQWGSTDVVRRRTLGQLHRALDNTDIRNTSAKWKAHVFYHSCMNKERIKGRGNKPLLDIIADIYKNFPFSNQTEAVLKKLHSVYGVSPFFTLKVMPDPTDSQRSVLFFSQPELGLPSHEHFLNKTPIDSKVLQLYLRYMNDVEQLLGMPGDEDSEGGIASRRRLSEALRIESSLAAIFNERGDLDDPEKVHNVTLQEMQNLVSHIDWVTYLQAIFVPFAFTLHDKIITPTLEYFKKLDKVLNSSSESDMRDYIIWSLVRKLSQNLDGRFEDAKRDLNEALYGTDRGGFVPRWEFCVEQTSRAVGFGLGLLYVEYVGFNSTHKIQVEKLIKNLSEVYKDTIDQLTWMDNVTSGFAKEKLDSIVLNVGYPLSDDLHPAITDSSYMDLTLTDDYFQNMLNYYEFEMKSMKTAYNRGQDTHKWTMTPQTVEADYNVYFNQITVPAAVAQPPFYSTKNLKFVNYAAIGTMIAHELVHAFDTRGSHYNYKGTLTEWWTPTTRKEFEEKASCMERQYGAYEEQGWHVDGHRTLGENIADNGGLHAACEVCVSAATQMLTYMDPSVPPCDDFYRYACGRWGARYPLPGGKKRWSVWDISFHHNLELIKNRLENGTFDKNKRLAAYDAQAFYLACMDEERVEDVGATPLLELLKEFGGWGVLGNSSHLNLTELMIRLSRKFLSPAIFDIDVVPGIDSPGMYFIKLSSPKLSLPSLYYSNNPVKTNKILPAYKEYMMRVTRLLGGGNSSCAEMEKVLAFEQDLANIIPDSKVEGSVNMTIPDFQKAIPFLNWTLYLSGLFSNGTYETQPLFIDSVPYFKKLSDYVKKSDPKTLTNYALWMLIQKMIPILDYRFRKAALIMAEAIDETTEPVRRWEFCMDLADKSLAYALGEIFAMKEITAKRKEDVKKMIDNLKHAFKDNLDHLPWMDNKTRLAAKEKAKKHPECGW
uniref:Putative endothelin-converting enzyme E n=1 Tax=Petromyzon marinus TaxID=7757 RepID=A0A1D8H2T9_PETMA|nr:putative endothelin-converting enzyme E [Petromyzon marinus]